MKAFVGLFAVFFCQFVFAQSIVGAWESRMKDNMGTELRFTVIFSDAYQVAASYDMKGNFISTNGGTWSLADGVMTEVVEFDSNNPDRVGSSVSFAVSISDSTIVTEFGTLVRIDAGAPGELPGGWLMSGRKLEGTGEIQERDTSGPRKTMKFLSGTRFQWIAYNTDSKEFLGTGGGTYTTIEGKYTETIEFFSRDVTRVGATLEFDYEVLDEKWHHAGLNSRGEPLYEVWSVRE